MFFSVVWCDGTSPEDPIDLTKEDSEDEDENHKPSSYEDKGKAKANPEENNQDDSGLLDYFNNLVSQRKDLLQQYEDASRKANITESEEDYDYMVMIGIEHDKIDNEIQEIVAQSDLLDPADDNNSDEEN
jgi:hypothetical protein